MARWPFAPVTSMIVQRKPRWPPTASPLPGSCSVKARWAAAPGNDNSVWAKFCATRYFYDNLGVNNQLRTYEGYPATLGHHQESINCGQCVCQDCPVSMRPGHLAAR